METKKRGEHLKKSESEKRRQQGVQKSSRSGFSGIKNKESQGRSYCEVQHDARNDDAEKEVFDGVVSQWQIQGTLRGSVDGS